MRLSGYISHNSYFKFSQVLKENIVFSLHSLGCQICVNKNTVQTPVALAVVRLLKEQLQVALLQVTMGYLEVDLLEFVEEVLQKALGICMGTTGVEKIIFTFYFLWTISVLRQEKQAILTPS